jgi:hypothetical protein
MARQALPRRKDAGGVSSWSTTANAQLIKANF